METEDRDLESAACLEMCSPDYSLCTTDASTQEAEMCNCNTTRSQETSKDNIHLVTCDTDSATQLCMCELRIGENMRNTNTQIESSELATVCSVTSEQDTHTQTYKGIVHAETQTCKENLHTQTRTCQTATDIHTQTNKEATNIHTQATELCKVDTLAQPSCTENLHTQTQTCQTATDIHTQTNKEATNIHTQATEMCKVDTHAQPSCTENLHTQTTEPCKVYSDHNNTQTYNSHTPPAAAAAKTPHNTAPEVCRFTQHTGMNEYKVYTKQCLLQLAAFLTPYLPLADSHTTDFITDDQWGRYIPAGIQGQLMGLTEEQLVRLSFRTRPSPAPQTFSLDSTLDPEEEKDEGEEEAKTQECCPPQWRSHKTLEDFISGAVGNSLPHLGLLTSVEALMRKCHATHDPAEAEAAAHFVEDFMSRQKSHEVAVMAQLCHTMCDRLGVNKVVDLGSGKGYLGTQLAFNHNMKVFGIDSADSNTSGASRRAKILQKQWLGLLKKFTTHWQDSKQGLTKTTTKETASRKIHQEGNHGNRAVGDRNRDRGREGIQKYFVSLPEGKISKGFYSPLTTYVSSDTDIVKLISECDDDDDDDAEEGDVSDEGTKLLVSGLHTCGDLCPTALRFFSQNPAALLLCNVSCCYHLLTEEFTAKGDPQVNSGFPLSSVLRSKSFYLGQNAKNLACQSINRISSSDKLAGKSLFQRALLQKIFMDTLPKQERETLKTTLKLRKVAGKCPSFYDYVKMALQKLGHSPDKVPEEVVTDYMLKYEEDRQKLAAFYQLKSILAPCIEAIITLDRIYFLLEQESVQDVYLLRLFDPVTSPRCYGIVATKRGFS
ncbi:methyltransferase-like protein 25 [Argonauta hians]